MGVRATAYVASGAILAGIVAYVVAALPERSASGYGPDRVARDLRSGDFNAFYRATMYLDAHPDQYSHEIQAALTEVVKNTAEPGSDEYSRQYAALKLLGTYDKKVAIPLLLGRLARDPGAYEIACLLGCIGDESAVEPLIALFDKKGHHGNCVHIALGRIGGERAVEFLVGRLRSDSADQDLIEAVGETRDRRALEPLLELCSNHKEGTLGMTYLVAIAKVSDERGMPLLLGASRSPEKDRRASAAEGLGRTHSQPALKRLEEMLGWEKDEQVRYSVAIGLALHGTEDAARLLAKHLRSETDEMIAMMTNGESLGNRLHDVWALVDALAATRRASGLVSMMEAVERINEFGAARYGEANRGNEANAESFILAVFRDIGQLRGQYDLIGHDVCPGFLRTADAPQRLQRVLDRHLAWWRKEAKTIRDLAEGGKELPFAERPREPFLDSR